MQEEKRELDLDEIAMEIITNVGTARSMYVEAVEAAKAGNFTEAHDLIREGDECFLNGHHAHSDLVNKPAGTEVLPYLFLMMHAEDQLMSADTLKIICEEFIDLLENHLGTSPHE